MDTASMAAGAVTTMTAPPVMDLGDLDAAVVYLSSAHLQTDEAARMLILQPQDMCRNALLAYCTRRQAASPHILNPHFIRALNGADRTLVVHFGSLALGCPVPGAINIQIIGRQQVAELLLERMAGRRTPLRRRILGLMQHLLLLEPLDYLAPDLAAALFQGHGVLRLPDGLWDEIPADAPAAARPVAYRAGSFHTGPYNYLEQPGVIARGSIHLGILVESARSRNRPVAVLAADPTSIAEAGLMVRIFRALEEQGVGAELLVLFFGTQAELQEAIRRQPGGTFFGDNIDSKTVRFLFSPFAGSDIIRLLREARLVLDTAYVTSIGPLAKALKLRHRIQVAADGQHVAWRDGVLQAGGMDPVALFSEDRLRDDGMKVNRRAERRLLQHLATLLSG